VVAHQNSAINQKRVFEEAQKAGRNTTEQLFLDMTFETKFKYKAGDQKVVVYYFGAGHTNGDAMIHFVDENVEHMGDLVFYRRFPYIDRSSGANIASCIKVLDKAIAQFGSKTQ
jgi:cyclase